MGGIGLNSEGPARLVRCVPRKYGARRYLLEIVLNRAPGPRLAVVLKNPSTASEERSDPTIGKVEAWARRRGFASVSVVNLFARRTPCPSELARYPYRKNVGPGNDRYILAAARRADLLVVAWGNPNGIDPALYDRRIGEVSGLLRGLRTHAVGQPTLAGYPRHGLVWNGDVTLRPYSFRIPS